MVIRFAPSARHCAVIAVLAAALLSTQSAQAANPDLIVTKFTDSLDGSCNSDCSLREAVQQANQTPGESRIILAAGTYQLRISREIGPDGRNIDDDNNLNGDLDIKGTITIVGRGIDVTVIDADYDRIAEVLPGAVATLSKLTVRNGSERLRGGGLDVNAGGTLNLKSCGVSSNQSAAGSSQVGASGIGGGIWNGGTLNIDASRIDDNFAAGGGGYIGFGGGIYNVGSLTVRDARFIGNKARSKDDGGGHGGAIYNAGTADIRRATFESNTITSSSQGAAIFNVGTLRLENSTITGSTNSRPLNAPTTGAINNGNRFDVEQTASAKLVNVTIAGNEIYGLVNYSRVAIYNSIIAGNGLLGDPEGFERVEHNCLNVGSGAQFSQVGLLRGTDDAGNCATTLLVLNSDSFETVMYPLALNGWKSPTFALRPGSIAIDAAVGDSCRSTDQRRVARPQDGDGNGTAICDIGAYEVTAP